MVSYKKVLNSQITKILIFAVSLWLVFNAIFFLGTHPTQLVDSLFQIVVRFVWFNVANETLRDFLVYGFLTGLFGFLIYVPNIAILFLMANFFHATGITGKAAEIADPIFRRLGLNGYSFPSLFFGFGCSVNAIHCAETSIEDRKNRLVTMLISPFWSCGAKFAVFVMLISVVFEPRYAGSILFLLYILGISFSIFSAWLFRKILKLKKKACVKPVEPTVLKRPDVPNIINKTFKDSWVFMLKAGSVIVAAAILIWALSYWPGYPKENYAQLVSYARENNVHVPPRISLSFYNSYMSRFGKTIEPVFRPLGQNWRTGVALINGLAGNKIILSSMVTFYGIEYGPESKITLLDAVKADNIFTVFSAFAMMLFVLLRGSCIASVAMFHNAFKSRKLTALFFVYPVISAWIVSVAFYQTSQLIRGIF
ncbi:Ferrous iron transport protein B [Chitinispirillum alkaliphilum]|nr:Ferrous iron transport protein B [Chitinispirillum alkaliphilum]